MIGENQGKSLDFIALPVITRNHIWSIHKRSEEHLEGLALLMSKIDHSPQGEFQGVQGSPLSSKNYPLFAAGP